MLAYLPTYTAPTPLASPLDLGLCETWYDAAADEDASNAPATNGVAVARALNKGSLGGYIAQATSGRRPLHATVSGKPATDYSGTAPVSLDCPAASWSSVGAATFVAVVKTPATAPALATGLIISRTSSNIGLGYHSANANQLAALWNGTSTNAVISVPTSTVCLLAVTFTLARLDFYVISRAAGTVSVASITTRSAITANPVFLIGRDSAAGARQFPGQVFHALGYTQALGRTQLELLADLLMP